MTKTLPMTTGRVVALIAGTPLALALIAATAFHWVADLGQGSYRVRLALPARAPAVEISVKQGDLTIGEEPDARLNLTGTVRYSLFRPAVTWHATRSGTAVFSSCNSILGGCAFDYRLGLPAGTPLVLTDNLGDITVTGVTSADVTATNQSGNVTLTFSTVPDRVTVSDQLGNITLVLPPGMTAYRVRARAGLGDTSIRVPTSVSSPHVIVVTDSSGNIEVTAASSAR